MQLAGPSAASGAWSGGFCDFLIADSIETQASIFNQKSTINN
jgi:hypothetical protein